MEVVDICYKQEGYSGPCAQETTLYKTNYIKKHYNNQRTTVEEASMTNQMTLACAM